jgi:hypothetical protein
MNENPWDEVVPPLSWVERALIEFAAFTPVFAFVALLVLLVATILLAIKTREPGRFLILVGVGALALQFAYQVYFPFGQVGSGLVDMSLRRLSAVVPAFFVAIGFMRLTLFAMRRHKSTVP